jgi:hypothetical protein
MWTGPDSISRWIEDFCLSEKGLYICVQKHLVGLIGVSEIDEKFHDRYAVPRCEVCGEDYLIANTYSVYEVELFCANVLCPAFVKTFWVKKSDLEER